MRPDDALFDELIEAGVPAVDEDDIEACLSAAPPLDPGFAERALARSMDPRGLAIQAIGTEVPAVSSGPAVKIELPAKSTKRARSAKRARLWFAVGLCVVGLEAAAFTLDWGSLFGSTSRGLERGDAAFARRDYAGALRSYLAAQKAAGTALPEPVLALRLGKTRLSLAALSERAGHYEEARSHREEAAENFFRAKLLANLEEAHFYYAHTRERLGLVGEELAALYDWHAGKWDGGGPFAALSGARYSLMRGDHGAALRCYSFAIERRPDLALAWRERAELRRRMRELREAGTDIERALLLDSQDPDSVFIRAHIRLESGDIRGARMDVDRGLELDKSNAQGLALRAHLRFRSGEFEAARADADAAVDRKPRGYYPFLVRAQIRESRDLEGALGDLRSALARAPRLAEIHVELGRVSQKMGALQSALDSYSKAIELYPEDHRSYSNRGTVYRRMQLYDDALNDLHRAVALAPESGAVRFQRAKARWTKLRQADVDYPDKRWDSVLADLTLAVTDAEVAGDAYGRRGYIRYKRGEFAAALNDYGAAIAINEKRDKVYIWFGYRALLNTTLKRYEDGLADAERFLRDAPAAHENRSAVRAAAWECRRALKTPR